MLFLKTAIDGLQMGLCYAPLALGVYISYSVLDFPDLSVDGTFPLGAVVSTALMLRLGVHPILAILFAFVVSAAAGAITGLLHVKLKIGSLLSGIIVMTGLLSVNLALTSLLTDSGTTTTIFSYRQKGLCGIFGGRLFDSLDSNASDLLTLGILVLLVVVVKLALDLFLKTNVGYMLRATGDNEMTVVSGGRDSGTYKILGLALANGLAGLSGALYSQLYMQYDNNMGSGKAVTALASVIIGCALFAGARVVKSTTAVAIGAVIYSLCLNFLTLVDTNGIYLKLMNALMFALILVFNDRISAFFVGLRHGKKSAETDQKKGGDLDA